MRGTPLEGVVRAARRLAAGDGREEVAVRAPAHEVVVSGRGEEGDAGEYAPVGVEEARVEGGRARGRVGHVAQVDEEGRAPRQDAPRERGRLAAPVAGVADGGEGEGLVTRRRGAEFDRLRGRPEAADVARGRDEPLQAHHLEAAAARRRG